mgnify:FL=1
MDFKDRIKWARSHAGLTQVELAKAINELTKAEDAGGDADRCTQVIISDLERGMVKRTGYLTHIAVACGVNPAWLAFGFEPREMDFTKTRKNRKKDELETGLSKDELATLKKLIEKANI